MRLHYFQHETFECPYLIEEWAVKKGFEISSTHFYTNYKLPDIAEIDWLVVMGGSMSVLEEDKFPWLKEEKAFLKKAIDSGKTVLGICLGAQMIANVLGAKVYPNSEKEIGWFPVKWNEDALRNKIFQNIPEELFVMHWHGETFNLPEGSLHLASSAACSNQAFIYREKVVGLQFHMEFNEDAIDDMLHFCASDLVPANYVQNFQEIVAGKSFIPSSSAGLISILDALY